MEQEIIEYCKNASIEELFKILEELNEMELELLDGE